MSRGGGEKQKATASITTFAVSDYGRGNAHGCDDTWFTSILMRNIARFMSILSCNSARFTSYRSVSAADASEVLN
jgi:hypothetical protein